MATANRYTKVMYYLNLLVLVVLLTVWPPETGYSQKNGIHGKEDAEHLPKNIQQIDSLTHALEVEIRLRQYQQNQADTAFYNNQFLNNEKTEENP